MIWLLPPLPSVDTTGDKQEGWERETTCWRYRGGEGVGEEPNHTTARKPGPLWCRIIRVYYTEPPPPHLPMSGGLFFRSLPLSSICVVETGGKQTFFKVRKFPYGVKQICMKWIWPVQVMLEVIKRCLMVFADLGDSNEPTLASQGRSIPCRARKNYIWILYDFVDVSRIHALTVSSNFKKY